MCGTRRRSWSGDELDQDDGQHREHGDQAVRAEGRSGIEIRHVPDGNPEDEHRAGFSNHDRQQRDAPPSSVDAQQPPHEPDGEDEDQQ